MIKAFSLATGGVWESLAEWYQGSVIKELLTYFEEKYFTIDYERYHNFSISVQTTISIRNFILALAFGIIVASAMIAHTKSCHGSLIRKLLRNDCTSPEKAKTLSELGLFHNVSIRRELKKGVSLRKLVYCREVEEAKKSDGFTNETQESSDAVEEPKVEAQTEMQGEAITPRSTEKPSPPHDGIKKNRFLLGVKKFFSWKSEEESVLAVDPSTMHFYIPDELRYRADIRYEKKGSGWLPFWIVSVATVIVAALLCVYLPTVLTWADNLISLFTPD